MRLIRIVNEKLSIKKDKNQQNGCCKNNTLHLLNTRPQKIIYWQWESFSLYMLLQLILILILMCWAVRGSCWGAWYN